MKKEKLNSLVVEYQGGNELALYDIFTEVNPIIERASRDLEYIVDNYAKFDCRVVTKINHLIKTFKPEEHDFLSAVKAVIGNEKAFLAKRAADKPMKYSKEALEDGDNEDAIGVEFRDHRVSVEADVLLKEKVAMLAQGDYKKETVLNEWTKGATSKSISYLLVQMYGGKQDSHYRFIKRFKVQCRELLLAEELSK